MATVISFRSQSFTITWERASVWEHNTSWERVHQNMADDDAQRYQCTYCTCDITLRLKCAMCADFDLCLQCFASGAVAGGHKKDHSYQLIDEGSFPLLVDDWGAIEEVLLLDAVEQDGFGNWEDIAAHVVTKTTRESKDHYSETYIGGIIGEGIIPPHHHEVALEGHGGEVPPSPPHFTPVKLEHAEQLELGYMPLRDDFEKEYDNDAETIISGISMAADEEEEDVERALKLAHMDMYNMRLLEREKRKRIAKQQNLIAGKQRQSAYKRKFTKEERELRAKYKTLARLMDTEEYEKFIASVKREKQLDSRIRELTRYRKNGVTKFDDCAEFDLLRHEQEKLKENRKDTDPLNRMDGSGELSDHDLVLTPSLSLLSSAERKLCHSVLLKPQQYLSLKTEVLKNAALKHSGYHQTKPKLPKYLNPTQKTKIVQFFTNSGWIN